MYSLIFKIIELFFVCNFDDLQMPIVLSVLYIRIKIKTTDLMDA